MLGLAIMCCKLVGWNYALYLATVLAPRRVRPLNILEWPLPQATDQKCPWPSRVVVSDFFCYLYCNIQSLSMNWSPWLYSGVRFLMTVLKNPKLSPYCGKQNNRLQVGYFVIMHCRDESGNSNQSCCHSKGVSAQMVSVMFRACSIDLVRNQNLLWVAKM